MSTWNTSAGTIGNFTQGQLLTFTLSASPSLGGTISYVLISDSNLPSGVTLNSTTGVISGIPAYVSVNTIYYFSVNAIETVNGIQNSNIRNFSINITSLVWNTSSGSIGVFAENVAINYQFLTTPSQSTNTVTYILLNGSLPTGTITPVSLSSTGLLTGIPNTETETTVYQFSIRAIEYNGLVQVGFKDRTFNITIDIGTPLPEFITPSGSLFSAYDSTWQSFQLQYVDQNPDNIITIRVAIGELPPGLEIDSNGLIQGYALPPVDVDLDPITATFDFTLEISSINGRSLSSYSITIINQQTQIGFIGRSPVILNNRPLSINIENDIYESYYITSDSLGNYPASTEFIFKIIGYNFDGLENDLTYVFNGPNIGLTYDSATGWISGLLPSIGISVETYNFTVNVYITSEPTLISDTLFFSITVVGTNVTNITWITPTDLGVINNGEISDLSLQAIGGTDLNINYRIIGTQIQSDLKTISSSGLQFNSFGDQGTFVIGSSNGQTWTEQTPLNTFVSFLYFTSSVYDSTNQLTILVGYDQTNLAIIGQLSETNTYTPSAVTITSALRKVIYISEYSLYIAVGDNGTITYTFSPDLWNLIPVSPTSSNLNCVCYSNETFGLRYVAVGDNGTILTSNDAVTWVQQVSGTTLSLRSVIFAENKFIAVGDLGVLIFSGNGINWSTPTLLGNNYNFKALGKTVDASRTFIVGNNGLILESFNQGLTWNQITNSISTSNLTDIIYDEINTKSFYIVGDGGTILQYNNDPTSNDYNKLTSPTLNSFPPDLSLLPSGEISGRLAFESTNQVQNQDTIRNYSLTIQAYYSDFPQINSVRNFTLTTLQKYYLPYDTVYIKALPSLDDRSKIGYLINNDGIIPSEYIYRPNDPYFGKSSSVIYNHIYGVPSVATGDFFTDYINAVQINHYWRNITLGELHVAVARDQSNTIVYEVVYSKIQDNLVNSSGQSISKEIVWPRNINLNLNNWVDSLTNIYTTSTYYDQDPIVRNYVSSLNSTTLVLNSVTDITVGMTMTAPMNFSVTNDSLDVAPIVISVDPNTSSVVVNVAQTLTIDQQVLFSESLYTSLTPGVARTLYPNSLPNMREQIYASLGRINDQTLLPAWMTSQQLDGSIPGFTPAWVICYVKPGYGDIVKSNIETMWPYSLNEIDFQLDRFEVDRSKTYNYQGTNFNGQPIWNTLPSAQPNVTNDDADSYVYFPRKTILPTQTQ